jgi:Family of unknown function (DUF6502)
MNPSGKAAMARAAMVAVEPIVEVLLDIGVTSPEAESLLRSVFVHKARTWLARQNPKKAAPSDARVSLVTGVHRNFVRHILAEPPRIAKSRQKKGSRASKVLNAWHQDPAYLDGSGKPRDLAEKGPLPSFQSLANTYLPGAAPGVLLDELKRARLVQSLSANRLRVRSKSFRFHGLNLASVTDLGARTRELVETLNYNIHCPDHRRFLDSLPIVELDQDRIAAVRELISRRSSTFLAKMEHELAGAVSASKSTKSKRKIRIGITIFSTERDPEN